MEEKSKKINHLDSALTGLQDHQKSKDAVLEDLQAEIQDCSIRKKRADILLRGLSSEKQKWIVCTRMPTFYNIKKNRCTVTVHNKNKIQILQIL